MKSKPFQSSPPIQQGGMWVPGVPFQALEESRLHSASPTLLYHLCTRFLLSLSQPFLNLLVMCQSMQSSLGQSGSELLVQITSLFLILSTLRTQIPSWISCSVGWFVSSHCKCTAHPDPLLPVSSFALLSRTHQLQPLVCLMLICMSTFTFIYFFRGSLDCAQALPVFTMNTSAMLKSKRHSFFRSEPPTSSVLFPCLLPSTSSFHLKGIFFRHNKALWGFTDLPRTDKAPTISFPSKGNRRRYYIKK